MPNIEKYQANRYIAQDHHQLKAVEDLVEDENYKKHSVEESMSSDVCYSRNLSEFTFEGGFRGREDLNAAARHK